MMMTKMKVCVLPMLVLAVLWFFAGVDFSHGQTAGNPLNLAWDDGMTDAGTVAVSQPSAAAGSYYYRINTRSVEAWRTRLTVTAGEANLYLFRGTVPVIGQAGVKASALTGNDGLILSKADFSPGEDWYLLVQATGAVNSWSLVTGGAYVRDLGSLPFTDSNGNGAYNIGEASQNGGLSGQTMPPEGVLFYKVTLPPNVPAWSLWLNGGTQAIAVRKSLVPILFATTQLVDRKQNGSLLLVPPYLGQGSDSYFVSVAGIAGSQISLDSRIQQIEAMTYGATVPAFAVNDAPYRVFQVDVPSGQLAWDVTLNRISGDPNVAVKKETVPSETENDAISDAVGAVNDSLTLVAPDLTNGKWFVTVCGTSAYETGIGNGTPTFTDLEYRSTVVNDQPERAGWRYYRVPDSAAQAGTLGWQLNLTGAPAGTEVAIRRTQAPGIWKKNSAGSTVTTSVRYVDAASKTGILQRVDHEADIWYVGVYQPNVPLGAFTLTLNDITAKPTALDNGSMTETDQIEGEWRYFRVVVPNDPNLLGWYLNLTNVTGAAAPKISVRRDRLPPATNLVGPGFSNWPSGAGWVPDVDFTGQMNNAGGVNVTGQRFLAARGTGRPLEPGTYYVGVLVGAAQPPAGVPKMASYTLQSRGIGIGHAIEPTDLPLDGGNLATGNLVARDFKMYRVTVPAGVELPSWRLELQPAVGEMFMQARRDSIPDFSTSPGIGESTASTGVLGGKRLKRAGAESLTVMPENGAAFIQPGTFYVAVVSEGLAPSVAVMGEGEASGTLKSTIPAPLIALGSVAPAAPIIADFDLPWGDMATYRFTVPAGMKVLEAYLTNREGNPGLSMIRGTRVPLPFPGTTTGDAGYGWFGGQTTPTHPVLVTAHDPVADEYTIVVRANIDGANFPRGKGKLNIRLVDALPVLGVTSGTRTAVVNDQIAESWRYFQLVVPNDANLRGIRVSLKNVTSGVPRMVIRKGALVPKDFTTSTNLNSNSTDWPVDQQWAQANDFTNLLRDSLGTVAAGRYFLSAYNSPMNAGTYIIGVTKDASVNTFTSPNTPPMNYSVVVEGIGDGLELPITPIAFDNTLAPALIDDLPERELGFYKVTVPAGKTSWRLQLQTSLTGDATPKVRDGGLAVRMGKIPAFDTGLDPAAMGGTTARLVAQGEHWTLLPKTSDGLLAAGDYFVAVTSFGVQPTTTQTGAGTSDLTLLSRGELPVDYFPPLSVENEAIKAYTLQPTELASYEFTVPARAAGEEPYGLRLSIQRGMGASNYSLRQLGVNGLGFPTPPGAGSEGFAGGLAAEVSTTDAIGGFLYAQIVPGTYRVVVRSSQGGAGYSTSTGVLSAQLLLTTGIPSIAFDGENLSAVNAGASTDIVQYRLEVPDDPNWLAWGIRLDGPISGKPALLIRRGLQVDGTTPAAVTSDMMDWPIGNQWTQLDDFTKLRNDPLTAAGSPDRDRSQQFFMAARDKPLQPGTYFIGIDNRGTNLISPRTYTIRTFAVGDSYSIPVTDLSATGAEAQIEIDKPRMPNVYKISVPPMSRGWAVSLTPTLGDMTLRVRFGAVPDPVNDTVYPDLKGGVHVQKSGNERFTLLPKPGNTYLDEGDYYVLAVSDGQNPSLIQSILGTGVVTGSIRNVGPITVGALGSVTSAGLSQPVSLEAGEIKMFTVDVPAGINNLQFKLNNRVGEATIAIVKGGQIPAPGLLESYGVFGGETAGSPLKERSVINLGNPAAGIYTIAIRAGGTLPSSFAPASATLGVDIVRPAPMNFSPELNAGNGLSNTDARSLSDKEKYFYQVPIPRQLDGADVLGWLITLEQGTPAVRIFKSASDFGKTPAVTMVGRSALIVPPLLTFDANWYIEIEGVGTSDYVLKSQAVKLTANPWTLPGAFNQLAGDTSPGAPEGAGIRRDLAQDAWEFYALDVPQNNLGLLRLALEQYGGNTNVYVRNDGIPTTDHLVAGASGNRMYQYKMIAETSEAGNFSEISDPVKQPERLLPGRWYIGVKSDPLASIRTASGFRLKAHSGVVTDLDLTTSAPVIDQNLAERDWRYYRFTVPRTGIPAEWKPFFSRTSGGAQAYIRDGLPPFSYVLPATSSITSPAFVEWSTDLKNKVPAASYVKQLNPGTITLPTPPLRPGSSYFLGLYGNTAGGSVDVSSSISPSQIPVELEMIYNSGTEAVTVPGNASRLVRISTTSDAARLKIECAQSAVGLSLKLEQGAPPYTAAVIAAHAQNASPYPVTHLFNQSLSTSWPFVPQKDYYLLLTNTTAAPITSTLAMKGSSILAEDEDGDGLADVWERLHFSGLTQTPTADFDGDGSTNLQEFLNQTLPKDASSVLYLLTLRAPGGAAAASPSLANYPSGAFVGLLATPVAGDTFLQWRSTLTAFDRSNSPALTLGMTANVEMTAEFKTSVDRGLDSPPSRNWTHGSPSVSTQWYGQYQTSHDGVDAAVSPAVSVNQQSKITSTFVGPGTLTFWWKVSSQANNGVLTLLINDVAQPNPISGIGVDWVQRSIDLPAGSNRVAWRYSRNTVATTAGENRGYVDQVSFSGDVVAEFEFQNWVAEQFSPAEQLDSNISGSHADPDLDLIPNLLEAAMGTSPKFHNGTPLQLVSTTRSGDNSINVLVTCRAERSVVNVKLELQACDTLDSATWTKIAERAGAEDWVLTGATIPAPESAAVNGAISTSIQESVPLPLGTRRFYRMAATLNP
jgi:large repetitive protein